MAAAFALKLVCLVPSFNSYTFCNNSCKGNKLIWISATIEHIQAGRATSSGLSSWFQCKLWWNWQPPPGNWVSDLEKRFVLILVLNLLKINSLSKPFTSIRCLTSWLLTGQSYFKSVHLSWGSDQRTLRSVTPKEDLPGLWADTCIPSMSNRLANQQFRPGQGTTNLSPKSWVRTAPLYWFTDETLKQPIPPIPCASNLIIKGKDPGQG